MALALIISFDQVQCEKGSGKLSPVAGGGRTRARSSSAPRENDGAIDRSRRPSRRFGRSSQA